MLTLVLLIAQLEKTAVDSLSGGGGWFGAGLLGAVLLWLMFKHLPAKDQQIKDILELHAKVIEARDIRDVQCDIRREAVEKESRETFTKALKEITDHCKEEMDRVLAHHVRVN